MFKRFDPTNDVSTSTQVKSSIARALKAQIVENHPAITEDQLHELLPKKSPLVQYKVGPHLKLYCRQVARAGQDDEDEDNQRGPSDEPVLFQHRDGPILPCLKLVHQYPTIHFQSVTVDKGAIPYLLGGANVMCPGLTNPGGEMPADGQGVDANGFDKPGLEKGAGVVIFAEGKEYAIAVGVMSMSSADVYVSLFACCWVVDTDERTHQPQTLSLLKSVQEQRCSNRTHAQPRRWSLSNRRHLSYG